MAITTDTGNSSQAADQSAAKAAQQSQSANAPAQTQPAKAVEIARNGTPDEIMQYASRNPGERHTLERALIDNGQISSLFLLNQSAPLQSAQNSHPPILADTPLQHAHGTPSARNVAPPTDGEIAGMAAEINDVGESGFFLFSDDTDARLEALAGRITALDAESGGRLIGAIAEDDRGALASWMNANDITRLHNEGRISDAEYETLSTAFTTAYNNGEMGYQQALQGLSIYRATGIAPALAEPIDNGFSAGLTFLNAGETDAVDRFREDFGQQMLADYSDPNELGYSPLKAAYATTILADAQDDTLLGRTVADFSPAQRANILQAVAEGGIGYLNSQESVPGLDDPLSALIDSVAENSGSRIEDLAVQISRFAETAEDELFYDYGSQGYQDPIAERAESLGHMFSEHANAILSGLAVDNQYTGTGSTSAEQNVQQLGNLLRLTALNTDNPYRDAVMGGLSSFVAQQQSVINTSDPVENADNVHDAYNALEVIGAASVDASRQALAAAEDARQARAAFVEFVVDVGLAAIPGGLDNVAGKAAVGSLFGSQSDRVTQALEGVAGEIFKPGTSQLTDAAKQAIADALGPEALEIESLQDQGYTIVRDMVLNGLEDGRDRNMVQNQIDQLSGFVGIRSSAGS